MWRRAEETRATKAALESEQTCKWPCGCWKDIDGVKYYCVDHRVEPGEVFFFTDRQIDLLVDAVALETAWAERNRSEDVKELNELGLYLASRQQEAVTQCVNRRLSRGSTGVNGRKRRTKSKP